MEDLQIEGSSQWAIYELALMIYFTGSKHSKARGSISEVDKKGSGQASMQ